ncbi:MAG TPA: site-2 protease family protein [Candidatus Thermoplasmatota archaeon]|nr:site-2 protease family protein [Candidatus Thermoplasmatota archaeon]
MNGVLVFGILLAAYLFLAYRLAKRKTSEPPSSVTGSGFDLAGPLILWRTQSGKRLIDRIAKARGLWRFFGDVAIYVTWVAGLLVLALLLYQLYLFVTVPKLVVDTAPPPQFLIGLPGVNPLIPIWYGIFGLLVALVVHEGCHGILARAQNIGVKSLGLVFFIVPIGAFVEPDERDLEPASARAKNRVFAAGPMSNLVLALVAGSLFSMAFVGSMAVVNDGEGVGVAATIPDSPAAAAGIRAGDVLVKLDGTAVTDQPSFTQVLNRTRAGQQVSVELIRDGKHVFTSVVLADKYEYIQSQDPSLNKAEYKGKGFIGVSSFDLGIAERVHSRLEAPFQDGLGSFDPGRGAFIVYISYPFFVLLTGVDVLNAPYTSFFVVEGPLAGMPAWAFFMVANALYWLFWLNLMLGTFNALPAGPLDGGQMLRTTLREWSYRLFRVDRARILVNPSPAPGAMPLSGADPETQARLDRALAFTKRITMTVGFFILGLILLPIIGPNVVKLLT